MKTNEEKIDSKSEYYINFPTPPIVESFFYPVQLGHFYYKPGYRLHRRHFDSFLLLYVAAGSFTVECSEQTQTARKNQFVLLDCYQEHCYYSETGWEALWIHFDGCTARKLYEMIASRNGNVFTLADPLPVLNRMKQIYLPYTQKEPIKEILLSKYLNDILTELLLGTPVQAKQSRYASAVEAIQTYVKEHLRESLSVEELARKAMMSPYHFIRIFKRETTMSPHEYIIHCRLQVAKILLSESDLSVGEICYEAGFSSDSVFCAAFKKSTGMSPTEYRRAQNF